MKKLIITALLAVFVATSALANDLRINSTAKQNFKSDFRNVSEVQWQAHGNFAFAIFKLDGKSVKAYYNEDGELFGTSRSVDGESLPTSVKRIFAKKYANYTLTDAIRFEGVEETAYYLTAETDNQIVVLKIEGGSLLEYKRVWKK